MSALAIATPAVAAAPVRSCLEREYHGPALKIFDTVPQRHGVIAAEHDSTLIRRGEVAVYDELGIDQEGIIDGAIYAIEYQRPRAGLPKHMWAASLDFRMITDRHLVLVEHFKHLPGTWATHPLRTVQRGVFVMSDFPLDEIYLRERLLGRVVGIYSPASIREEC